ncbi:MAG: YgiQ family radical SAM protein [bacterium]
MTRAPPAPHLPASPDALRLAGYRRPDVLLITGDAFVDHPSFGAAVVGRLLESFGLVVAVADQPDWRDPTPLEAFGRPRLFVGITAGNMDSLVNHQTALRKRRHDDAYSPGGRHGLRPNRAAVVYTQLARRAFPDCLLILGGVEASLRRFAHYDYWADDLRRSALVDARADLLVYGMAERPLRAVCDRLAPLGEVDRSARSRLVGIRGTAVVLGQRTIERQRLDLSHGAALTFGPHGWEGQGPSLPTRGLFRDPPRPVRWVVRRLPSFERIQQDATHLAAATRLVERAANPALGHACVQRHGEATVLAMPPAWPLTTAELDAVHELPFTRAVHPRHAEPVPAFDMISSSVQITRGCFGGCTFCAISLHEGRAVQSRSRASVLREVAALQKTPTFRGTISDLGGPTANTYGLGCNHPAREARCRRPSCLHPRICPMLRTDPGPLITLLRAVREAPGVRHALVASGVRHDLALVAPGYLDELLRHHVGGHLHVAPEHNHPDVLRLARKPPYELFERFREQFERTRRRLGVERYLNPYFVSGLPGSTDARMAALVRLLRAEGWKPRQVQAFLPTPGSAATAMFYSGRNPDRLGERVTLPRSLAEKLRQHHLLTADLPRE